MWHIQGWDLETVSDASSIITALASLGLAWAALKFTVKPRIRIHGEETPVRGPSESVTLEFHLKNVGYRLFLAHPPATNISVWVNVDKRLEPIRVRFGSLLDRENTKVRRGKAESKYLSVKGMHLVHGEEGETLALDLRTPSAPGKYDIWLTLVPSEGGHTIYKTSLEVRAAAKPAG